VSSRTSETISSAKPVARSYGRANTACLDEVVTEVGSGLNAKRPGLTRLLADASATRIIVEHRDRLARFGVEHLAAALKAQGRVVLFVEVGEVDEVTEVLTSFCARLYARRGARNRALRAIRTAKNG